MARSIKATVGLGNGNSIPVGFIYCVWDGRVHGNEARMMKGFVDSEGKALGKHKLWMFVSSTQSSEAERKDKVRGTGSIAQVEFLYLVTGELLVVPTRDRLF